MKVLVYVLFEEDYRSGRISFVKVTGDPSEACWWTSYKTNGYRRYFEQETIEVEDATPEE